MAQMKIVIYRVGKPPVVEEVDHSYESMRALVDGDLEAVYFPAGVVLWCDEEGRMGKPFNRNVLAKAPDIGEHDFVIEMRAPGDPPFAKPGEMGYHRVYGDFFFARRNDEGETISLTDKDVEILMGAAK